ncbi:MAG TPA: hypothetical protein VJ044_05940, partial [Candidatus Hodarchaeales archaeon]|nr:hypothetical protein [Candidatus Hodarchaeales archaeon]
IRGAVNADCTIARGAGFTVNKTGTGTYTVTFSTAFSGAPVVVVCLTASVGIIQSANHTTSDVGIATYNTSSAPADIAFQFIAEGPS